MAPALWRFGEVEKLMLEAGDVITAEEAERRVLVLENPGEPGKSRITNSLFAGIQLIMPGEIADAHQHVSSAIRFVLKGKGAYTAVEGEKAQMEHGDFIITANWAPHDHGNPGKEPVMWLDVLDMPTVNHFQASFASHFDEKMQNVNHQDGDSFERYATGVLPDGAPVHLNRSPVINYPYAKMRPILERLKSTGDVDKRHGARVRYANPIKAGQCCPPWAPISPCCRKDSKANHTAQPTAPYSLWRKAVAQRRSTAKPLSGASTTYSWCRLGSATRTQLRMSTRCCSQFPIDRRRKRWASGARATSDRLL
jgi:gentisate 1,2-dioxygenase